MTNLISVSSAALLMKILLIGYTVRKAHIIVNLIIIEFMTMAVAASMGSIVSCLTIEPPILLFALILIITERIVGLSLVISIIRTHRNDYLKSRTTTKF